MDAISTGAQMTGNIISTLGDIDALPVWPKQLRIHSSLMDELGLPDGSTDAVERLHEDIYDSKKHSSYYYLYFRFRSMPKDFAYETKFCVNSASEVEWLDDVVDCRLVEKRMVTTMSWVGAESVSR